jgi:hypothetical protein
MKGLIIKDLFNLKKYAKLVAGMFLILTVYAIVLKDITFLTAMIPLYFAMMTITSFSYDELAKWDSYALSMPITRKDMVLSKYLLALILQVVGIAISIVITIIISYMGGNILEWDQIKISLAIMGAVTLFISIILPLIYKFGVEKSRLSILAVCFIPTILVVLVGKTGLTPPTEDQIMSVIYLFPIVIILVVAASFIISCNIYRNKDM